MKQIGLRSRLNLPKSNRKLRLASAAVVALGLFVCSQTTKSIAEPKELVDEYGEWLAAPEELADVPVNRIARSLRLNGQAMRLGREVFAQHCASCHGDDLKGRRDHHTPDLTDDVWRFSGDDLESGGVRKFPSDVEWTVRYGIRSGHPYARGAEVNMLAFDPKYRTKEDTEDFGDKKYLTDAEIDDVVEFVMQISGRPHDRAKAARGEGLFNDNAKGNCVDCHDAGGTGIDTFGSTNLTRPDLYLYGASREEILDSVVKGRHGFMPAFYDTLKPEELKAVSIFVFASAKSPKR
jgi:cytochrome c oxidase cbb3-type subunit III